MKNILIREAKDSDIQDILTLAAVFGPVKTTFEEARQTFETFTNSGFYTQFVAESDGKIVGMIAVVLMPGFRNGSKSIGYLQRLVVLPEYRKKGIGSALIDYAVKFCQNRCYKVILHSENPEAMKIYEKAGFKKHSTLLQLSL